MHQQHVVKGTTPRTKFRALFTTYRFISQQAETQMKPSVKELLSKPTAEIIEFLGTIYEHSPWVAEILTSQPKDPYASIETVSQLAAIMKDIVDKESKEMKLKLLCAHPDLCEKVGTLEKLTPESQEEQSKSGLQSLTNEELERFTLYNSMY